MIYTCTAGGTRSPPAFFLKNKYKEPMKMQNENTKRVWLYARIPGNDGETLRCIRECAAKAEQDNCKIVGTSADERYGWLLGPGYREMMRPGKLTAFIFTVCARSAARNSIYFAFSNRSCSMASRL